jgi:hypothetical protein
MPQPAATVTIFVTVTLLSFYGSRVWDDVLDLSGLAHEAMVEAYHRLRPDEASVVLTSVSHGVRVPQPRLRRSYANVERRPNSSLS